MNLLQSLFLSPPHRVAGTAVFFRAEGDGVPHAMLHNLLHNKVLHERIIFLTVFNADIPRIPPSERVAVEPLGHQCYQVNVRSEEHTSELQSLMRISYAGFCLKKQNK